MIKRQQDARHVLLSGYAATGDTVARDKMIAAIERAAGEQQKSYRAVAVMAVGCLCLATLVVLAGWLFGHAASSMEIEGEALMASFNETAPYAAWRHGYRTACEHSARFIEVMLSGRPLPESMPREDIEAMFRDVAREIKNSADTLTAYYQPAPLE